jgi:hypothetical protein
VIVLESLLPQEALSDPNRVCMQATFAALLQRQDTPGHGAADNGSAVAVAGFEVSRGWGVRALKQKIQTAGGSVFQLNEIYGIDGNNGRNAAAGDGSRSPAKDVNGATDASATGNSSGGGDADRLLESGAECVICLTEHRDTTILPCRHMCLCHDCAQQLRMQTNKCPICRTPVENLLQIKVDSTPGAT